jgi:hypothetical protein
MTDIRYLNDKQEYKYAWSLLINALLQRKKRCNNNLTDFVDRLSQMSDDIMKNICVFSLSEERDQLSQWRGYCHQGIGFSIGFKPDLLKPFLDEQDLLLAPCVYDEWEQEHLIDNIVRVIEGRVIAEFKAADTLNTSLLDPFSQIAPFIKHPKFIEENEWRIVTKDSVSVRNLEYRAGTSMLIPYFNAKIDPASPPLFPIREIIVGPSLEQKLAMHSVSAMFLKHNFEGVIMGSLIPFRST